MGPVAGCKLQTGSLIKGNVPIDNGCFSKEITRVLEMQTKVNRLLLTVATLAFLAAWPRPSVV
ncbi:MAG: hypothetical protein Ct9H300mP7_2810 [Verrucomicrobiota bacterium]|nr:MAG: hypothetical protein Ct9H300mP7_2810 [Verrucomicrobiota bacterium]